MLPVLALGQEDENAKDKKPGQGQGQEPRHWPRPERGRFGSVGLVRRVEEVVSKHSDHALAPRRGDLNLRSPPTVLACCRALDDPRGTAESVSPPVRWRYAAGGLLLLATASLAMLVPICSSSPSTPSRRSDRSRRRRSPSGTMAGIAVADWCAPIPATSFRAGRDVGTTCAISSRTCCGCRSRTTTTVDRRPDVASGERRPRSTCSSDRASSICSTHPSTTSMR